MMEQPGRGERLPTYRSSRRRRSSSRGQALVETSLLLPILIFLVGLGSMVGQMTMAGIDASNAARAGAISASYQLWKGNAPDVQASNAATWACNEQAGNGTTCTPSCSSASCTFNGTTSLKTLTVTNITDGTTGFKFAIVTVTAKVTPMANLLGIGSFTLKTTVRAMAEQ